MTITSCNTILSVPDNSDMQQKAKAQLLALWLNIVSSKLNYDAALTIRDPQDQTITITPKQAVASIESTILNATSTPDQMEYAKNLAEILDNL